MEIKIFKDADELSVAAADFTVQCSRVAMAERKRFTIALSGGSTPKKLHSVLASAAYRERIDWDNAHVFWGDERYVPFDDERNNARMAFQTLLNHVPVQPANVHVMRTDIDAGDSADEYEDLLHRYFREGDEFTFDLVILGLGDNAHTLSLFPGEPMIHEKHDWAASLYVREINMQRITLTPPPVNLAKNVMFLVSGAEKSSAAANVLNNAFTPDMYPAQIIRPLKGNLFWFLDQAAGARVKIKPGAE